MSYKMNSFPIQKGNVNITTGNVEGNVLCVEDGTLTVTWEAGGTDNVALIAGGSINLVNASSAAVVSGTFHYAI